MRGHANLDRQNFRHKRKQLLESFIQQETWDEAHLFIGNKFFHNGIKAPQFSGKVIASEQLDMDKLIVFQNS